jgi:hypothetical protein
MNIAQLNSLLLNNVVDVRFVRKSPLPYKAPTRRMLCTKSYSLLNSTNGRIVLNYRPPKYNKQFNEFNKNTLVVYDVIMMDYRNISCDSVEVVRTIPANDEFWKFFNEEIYILTTEQKIQYMDS